jgi:hypothetical protein
MILNVCNYLNDYAILQKNQYRGKLEAKVVIKAIGNNEERKGNHSTETQDFNVENPLQQREVKTTGASQQNFTISGVCLQTPWVIL